MPVLWQQVSGVLRDQPHHDLLDRGLMALELNAEVNDQQPDCAQRKWEQPGVFEQNVGKMRQVSKHSYRAEDDEHAAFQQRRQRD